MPTEQIDPGDEMEDEGHDIMEISELIDGGWGKRVCGLEKSAINWQTGEAKVRELLQNYGSCVHSHALEMFSPP